MEDFWKRRNLEETTNNSLLVIINNSYFYREVNYHFYTRSEGDMGNIARSDDIFPRAWLPVIARKSYYMVFLKKLLDTRLHCSDIAMASQVIRLRRLPCYVNTLCSVSKEKHEEIGTEN